METAAERQGEALALRWVDVEILRRHRSEQGEQRRKARRERVAGDWVFVSPTGEPLNPNTDCHEWKAATGTAQPESWQRGYGTTDTE